MPALTVVSIIFLPHQHAIAATYHQHAIAVISTPSTRIILKRTRGGSTPSTRARLRGAGWATSFRGAVAAEHSARRLSVRLWAGPFCSSRRPSRSASHESGREGWKCAGRVSRLAAHCAARRGGVSAACARALAAFWLPCVFCYLLRVRALGLQAAWRAVAGSSLVWFWRCF